MEEIKVNILEVISVYDISERYVMNMVNRGYKNFKLEEPILEIVCLESSKENPEKPQVRDHHWRESEYEKFIKQGYYLKG